MTRMPAVSSVALAVIATLASAACKGETVVKDRQETLDALAECREDGERKKSLIKSLESRLADIELAGGGGELVVRIEGADMVISGGSAPTPSRPAASNGQIKKLTSAFLDQVQKSRSAMGKCYQGALKKNTALQAKPIDLDIEVKFKASGAVGSARFRPRLSSGFNACMTTVAKRWKLSGAPTGVTFRQRVSLSPK